MRRTILFAALAAWLAITGCEDMSGSTSTGNAGNGSISGKVVDAAGRGVANAKVRVVSVDHNPGPGGGQAGELADVVTTGADGSFRTDSLPEGRYNLLGGKEGLLAFRDSVAVSRTSAAQVGGVTLKEPGTVSGVVRLQPGHDSRTVFLLLLGTTVFAVPKDSAGNFRLGPLAEGEYRLRLLSTLDAYRPLDTTLVVRAGVDTTLADTLRLAYEGAAFGELPPMNDVALAFDTTHLRVTLAWPRPRDSRVAAYHVYRRSPDSSYARLTEAPLTDTAFTEDWTTGIRPGETYHYAVTSLDRQGNESRKADPKVLAMTSRFREEALILGRYSDLTARDIAPDGAVWSIDDSGKGVTRLGPSGELSRWDDSAGLPFGPV